MSGHVKDLRNGLGQVCTTVKLSYACIDASAACGLKFSTRHQIRRVHEMS